VTEAARFVHSLKGLAGQLGAHELQSNAAALQAGIKAAAADLASPLRALAASLGIVIAGLAKLQAPPPVHAPSGESAVALVERVSALVSANDPDARPAADCLRDALSGSVRSEADTLIRRLDQYDFEGARQILGGLVDSIKAQGAAR